MSSVNLSICSLAKPSSKNHLIAIAVHKAVTAELNIQVFLRVNSVSSGARSFLSLILISPALSAYTTTDAQSVDSK